MSAVMARPVRDVRLPDRPGRGWKCSWRLQWPHWVQTRPPQRGTSQGRGGVKVAQYGHRLMP